MSINTRKSMKAFVLGSAAAALGVGVALNAFAGEYDGPYEFGAAATAADIASVDIDAMPDGRGLPAGQGTPEQGKTVYMEKCVACHGQDLGGVKGTGGAALIGGRDTLASGKPKKTVESYWPYSTIVFDYVKRAMPFNAPGSLSDDEIYAVTAFILAEANIIQQGDGMDASTLPQVRMPNRDGFVADPRPEEFSNN
jgi:cytochrome c